MLPEQEEEYLVEQAQAGDPVAFGILVDCYQPSLRDYLLHLVGDRETAFDLTQEVFVRAYCAIRRTPSGLRFRPWLYRIATNLACDHLRRQRLRQSLSWHRPYHNIYREGGSDVLSALVERAVVQDALAQLPPAERLVLLLCGLEHLPYKQAGAVLSISAEAARKRFHRARERFRRVYAEINQHETKDM